MDIDIEYASLQNEYRKLFNNGKDIFPNEWYFIKEYELKKEILKECVQENILIKESSNYFKFREKALNNVGKKDD